jgi:hypothetical protein
VGSDPKIVVNRMLAIANKLRQRARALLPIQGFFFDRPVVVLQSDDWGRVGLRDRQGLEELQSAGLNLGERPYDFYSLETAQDVGALSQFLKRHRDATGRPACIGMNFLSANLDFAKMAAEDFHQIHLRALPDGLPDGWHRPGLLEAYREGVDAGVFYPALHGQTHFCLPAVEREIGAGGERSRLLKTLWKAGTPYIHWRVPWIGYEYWDSEQPADQRFLSAESQAHAIGDAVGHFARLFSTLPRSACAPGYRANEDTHKAWAHFGVRVAQNGPGTLTPPHLDVFGLLHLYRTLDFEPALDNDFSIEATVNAVRECFARGTPAIVSIHSINFHSSVKDFRSRTLELLDRFLSELEAKHPDLLYLHDGDVYDLVMSGTYASASQAVALSVSKRAFTRSSVAKH